MPAALIGMGSNIEPERHLASAAAAIRERFPDSRFSSVYRSRAIGMQADDFLNACCLMTNAPDEAVLRAWLKEVEDTHGRERTQGSWQSRTLDLDLLMYGDVVRDDDLFRYPHVYIPAGELIAARLPAGGAEMLTEIDLRL
ncbi:MAG: 2-amino-4-hydroxy-6-hydroxymethyldihydropteridine diphosphokinase [Mariprofundaceae bacterium]|nr:2-amino-4-hydroxy-6-hydroxymethyldihydropteridine diphosphokinase [Mariprofundaceae bacterium]